MPDPRSRRFAAVTAKERQARAVEAEIADTRSRLRAVRSIDPVGSEARALDARLAELEQARVSALKQAKEDQAAGRAGCGHWHIDQAHEGGRPRS